MGRSLARPQYDRSLAHQQVLTDDPDRIAGARVKTAVARIITAVAHDENVSLGHDDPVKVIGRRRTKVERVVACAIGQRFAKL